MSTKHLLILSKEINKGDTDEQTNKLSSLSDKHVRNQLSIEWWRVSSTIIDVCIAMYPLHIPPYVLLEIIDWFPFYNSVNRKKKIDLILNVKKSIEKILK